MDTELTPALERVAASVIETQRRRQLLQDELAVATEAIASLQEQSVSLESSVLDLRRQLEETLQAKLREDDALEELATKRAEAFAQMEDLLAHIDAFAGERERAASGFGTEIDSSRLALSAIEEEVRTVKGLFASIAREATSLRTVLDSIRQSAAGADAQLADIGSKAKELDTAADGMAARVCRIAEAVDRAEKDKQHIMGADELRELVAGLQTRKAQVESAANALEQLAKDRERSAETIAKQLARIDQLCTGSAEVANAVASGAGVASAHQKQPDASVTASDAPARYGGTLGMLEFLAAQGLLSSTEAVEAAQLLHTGGVDKLVRSWWSRAMASPTPGYYRLVIGQSLGESGDTKGALTFLNRAMEGKQTDPFIAYLVALALLEMKRYVDVLRIAAGLSRTRHGKALAQNIEALHLAGSRHYDEAESKLAQALTMPGLSKLHYNETLYNLGCLAENKGDLRAATAWREKLTGIEPTYRDIANHIERRKAPAAVG